MLVTVWELNRSAQCQPITKSLTKQLSWRACAVHFLKNTLWVTSASEALRGKQAKHVCQSDEFCRCFGEYVRKTNMPSSGDKEGEREKLSDKQKQTDQSDEGPKTKTKPKSASATARGPAEATASKDAENIQALRELPAALERENAGTSPKTIGKPQRVTRSPLQNL